MNKQAKDRQSIISDATNKLLNMFETGEMPEAIAITIIRKRDNDDQPSFYWSIGNQILMYAQGTTDARGYDQWRKVGRYINKGSAAIWILAPLTRKFKDESRDVEKIIITGFKPIPIFKYEDTDGNPMTKAEYAPAVLPPFWEVATNLGIQVDYAPISGGYYGKYSPISQKIILCSQDAFVFFHELSHAVHGTFTDLKCGQVAEQEIVAELTAAVLCQLQKIQGYESQAFYYIKDYAAKTKEQDAIQAIMRVLSDVEKIVSKILDASDNPVETQAITA